jgi:wyosine [tRNA(Phe)-imidazoG37] synthetase (radical SAM superfamily)
VRTGIVIEVTDKTTELNQPVERKRPASSREGNAHETAFGCPRDFLENRFVYVVVSARARGLSIGVNVNPDKRCDFDCVYCEVNRNIPAREPTLDVDAMAAELKKTIDYVREGRLRERPGYRVMPDELLQLRHVALSGDGEPTLAPNFEEVLQEIIHVRALTTSSFFKLVLITNSVGLDLPQVQQGLKHFKKLDEVWAKLDGGTQAYLDRVNKPGARLDKILSNILLVARQRPVVIQSLFPAINGEEPPLEEIDHYAARLKELRQAGAQISLVQIYSAARPTTHSECGHLSLKCLSRIAQTVRQVTGLKAEVF